LVSPVARWLVAVAAAVDVETTVEPWKVRISYPVIGLPPSEDGALQCTRTDPSPGSTRPIVGAPGGVAGTRGVTDWLRADSAPVPAALVAATATW
jgi:hypothetical protein